jgi:hypothetical protein
MVDDYTWSASRCPHVHVTSALPLKADILACATALRFQASGLALIWHRLTPDVSQAKLILIKVPIDAL